jgi:putative ABC transport system permease protein
VTEGRRVVVLTDPAAGMLEMDVAAGTTIRIGGIPFEVVGVVRAGAEQASQTAYIPVTSAPKAWTVGYPYTEARLRAHLKSESDWSAAQRQLLAALAKRLPKETMDHLDLRGNIPDRTRLSGLRRAAAIRASIIGFSALLIALVGLANMLLVSVSEQTREIGLRRACGASRSAIALGVLLEALVICLPGCVVGLGLGIGAAHFVGAWAHLTTAVPAFWIVVSAGTALLGGVLASLIPAVRAAMLHPVVALRSE